MVGTTQVAQDNGMLMYAAEKMKDLQLSEENNDVLKKLGLHYYKNKGEYLTPDGVMVNLIFVSSIGANSTEQMTKNTERLQAILKEFSTAEPSTTSSILKSQMKDPTVIPTLLVLDTPINETGNPELQIKGDELLGAHYVVFKQVIAELVKANGGAMPDLLLMPSTFQDGGDASNTERKLLRLKASALLPTLYRYSHIEITKPGYTYGYISPRDIVEKLPALEYLADRPVNSLSNSASERWNLE